MRRTLTIIALVVATLVFSTGAAYARPEGWNTICLHIVKPHETLMCIARAYGVDPAAIATYNGLANPNRINVGQVLKIPNAFKMVGAGPVCVRQCGAGGLPACPCAQMYTVKPGDNLFRIAARFGTNMWAIAACNGILNLNRISVGQTLCITPALPF